jgi:isopenicillin-N epimerase
MTPPLVGRAALLAFHLDPSVTFLNHGSFGATPRAVLAAQDAWRARMERQPVQFFGRDLPGLLRDAAATMASFVGAAAEDLVFVANASEGTGAVLLSLDLRPGDRLLVTDHGYGAVRQAIRRVADMTGAALDVFQVPQPWTGEAGFIASLDAALAIGPRPKLLIVDAVTSPTAIRLPVAGAVARAHAAGVPVLVDAAHAPGMLPLDLATTGADWSVGNAHKWLFAPKGSAFLHAQGPWRERTLPLVTSHDHLGGFTRSFGWTGTRDPTAWLAIDAALTAWRAFGGWDLAERNKALANAAADILADALGAAPTAPAAARGTMVAVPIGAGDAAAGRAINQRLIADHAIEVPVMSQGGRLLVRVSAQIYNEIDDYHRLAKALAALR